MSGALRFVLVLVLSLAIPAYGFAGLAAQQAPCPMASADSEHVTADALQHGESDAKVDCCAGQDDSGGGAQACDMNQDCAGVHAVHVPATTVFAASVSVAHVAPLLDSGWPIGPSRSIWRPPAAL